MMLRRCAALLALLGCWIAAAPAEAQPTLGPLLPLARGQLLVSLGDPPEWLPESGAPETLTLFSGRPRGRTGGLNAYLAIQGTGSRCARSATAGHSHLILPRYYAATNLVSRRRSPFAPNGGAVSGDYAAAIPGVVVRRAGTARICVWLARAAGQRVSAVSQDVRLLNGLFAASVSAIPSAAPNSAGRFYTLNAIDVGRSFDYGASTTSCGGVADDGPRTADAGELATESITYSAAPCAGDGSEFTFTTAGGGPLGSLSYAVSQALTTPPQVTSIGACELDAVTVVPLAQATGYVQAVGCRVGRLLLSPYSRTAPRGAVLQAQVNGGVASIAPRGTAVDLVLNGRPSG
jgi:hypothetical protein